MAFKRHRLSTIDQLPAHAEADVIWAIKELEAGKRQLIELLPEFNARLTDKGIAPVSRGVFSRYALRKRRAFTRLKEVREISNAISNASTPASDEALTEAVAHMVKTAIFELVESGNDLDAKAVMEMAKALQATVLAQRSATSRRQSRDQESAKKEKSADQIMREAGLSDDTIAQLRRDFMGARKQAKKDR